MYHYTILLPAYNEENSVVPVIEGIKKEMSFLDGQNEILIIDDGSTDQTAAKLATIEGIRLITHERNLGYGASIKTGVRNSHGEKIMLIDADSSYPVEKIRQMITEAERFDMVVGARQGFHLYHQVGRGVMRYLFKVVASIFLQTWIKDLNSGMRVIDAALLKKYVHRLPDGFSASSTLTAIFIREKHTIQYVDIPYRARTGISKLNVILDGFRFFRYILFKLPKLPPAGTKIPGE